MLEKEIYSELPDGVVNYTEAGAIEIFENIMSEEAAKKIIQTFEDSNDDSFCPLSFDDAFVGGGQHGGNFRSNLVMSVGQHHNTENIFCECGSNQADSYIREIFVSCVNYYIEKYDVPINFDEGFQLLKYGPGKEYKPHADYGPGHEHRVVSGIIYLNPWEYEGGGTYFVNFKKNIKPLTPSIAIFPSNYAYLHTAKAVLSGTKYAIVTWMGE